MHAIAEDRPSWVPLRPDDAIEEENKGAASGTLADNDFPIPNGIDALTGEPWTPATSAAELGALLGRGTADEEELALLRAFSERCAAERRRRALKAGVDAADLAAAGWGVVFAQDADPRVRGALSDLIEHRREQTRGPDGHPFEEYVGTRGYRRGESAQRFLHRHGGASGPVDPARMPYYLLLVGGPEEIPFHVQSQLGVRHAVGRVAFDRPEDYRRYAASVVAAERSRTPPPPDVAFWSARHAGDRATARSHAELVLPLSESVAGKKGWRTHVVTAGEASRARLLALLGGDERASLVFTAGHGLVFRGHPEQERLQGALLASDWPGERGPVAREHYLAAADVADGASLSGTIVFTFACYGGGTPRYDSFAVDGADAARRRAAATAGLGGPIAARPFVAALPRRLLSLPGNGGALAVVGHVDRLWSTSFSYLGPSREATTFVSVLADLLAGQPLGHAMQYLSQRWAELASDLALVLDPSLAPADPDAPRADAASRARMWLAANDARSFVLLGDPAVRLGAALGGYR